MTTPRQPGWYDDPHDSNAQRYWDGQDWAPNRQRKPLTVPGQAAIEGTPFGRYRLVELLARGGMGEVWRAYDAAHNNRIVAIKLLPPHLASDRTYVQRFRREADATARLNNPHVIPIHSYGEIDGRLSTFALYSFRPPIFDTKRS
jgi:serine/threonine protein kinase